MKDIALSNRALALCFHIGDAELLSVPLGTNLNKCN